MNKNFYQEYMAKHAPPSAAQQWNNLCRMAGVPTYEEDMADLAAGLALHLDRNYPGWVQRARSVADRCE